VEALHTIIYLHIIYYLGGVVSVEVFPMARTLFLNGFPPPHFLDVEGLASLKHSVLSEPVDENTVPGGSKAL
jgi:hypothetical protein